MKVIDDVVKVVGAFATRKISQHPLRPTDWCPKEEQTVLKEEDYSSPQAFQAALEGLENDLKVLRAQMFGSRMYVFEDDEPHTQLQ